MASFDEDFHDDNGDDDDYDNEDYETPPRWSNGQDLGLLLMRVFMLIMEVMMMVMIMLTMRLLLDGAMTMIWGLVGFF